MERIANPGAFKVPPGSKDRERFAGLEARLDRLEAFITEVIERELIKPSEEPARRPGRPRKTEE
jgi:hypothetical protein